MLDNKEKTLFLFVLNLLQSFMIPVLLSTTSTTEEKFLMMPKCWCNQNKTDRKKCAIMKSVRIYYFIKYIQHHVFFSSFKICHSALVLRESEQCRPSERNASGYITFCRKETLSRTPVTEFVFQYMNHNPLKQGSHYVNRVLHAHTVDPCSWIYSTGPEML